MNNPITECLYRAYAACERGAHRQALEHLRDGADLAELAGDDRNRAACIRAYVIVARAAGYKHLAVQS